ncbi:MAG: hypothetical protein KDD40_02455 [Bdellovibrionales bacterium]|nr:hypothetical protein [Bdellovibrionales bacterium]
MEKIEDLCSVSEVKRDYNWEKRFLDAFVQAQVSFIKEEPVQGPDGWPYFFVKLLPTGQNGEPVAKLLNWLKDKGIGIAVNPHKELPDYIFNYGMIWNYAERQLLVQDSPNITNEDTVDFKKGENIYFGCPSTEYLPPYVVKVLLDFFAQQNINEPRVAIVGKNKDNFDLCFSLESLGNPPEEEHNGILEAISWFLPTHYSLMLLSEEAVAKFFTLNSMNDFASDL